MRRVVATGVGVVCALGAGREVVWSRLLAGDCGGSPITKFSTANLRTKVAGEVDRRWLSNDTEADDFDLAHAMLAFAANEALTQAEALDAQGRQAVVDPPRGAAFVGSHYCGLTTLQHGLVGEPRAKTAVNGLNNHGGAFLAIRYGLRGPNLTVTTACASAANAVGLAFHSVRAGAADLAVCGGMDELGGSGLYTINDRMRAMTPEYTPVQPLSSGRRGFAQGEGAAVLVLEAGDVAAARGVKPIAEICGYANTCDGDSMTSSTASGDSLLATMQLALLDARVRESEIDYINAHATGTPQGDAAEGRAIMALLGSRADVIPVSSIKRSTGHCFGAAGAIEAAISALAVQRRHAPPTVNYTPDPQLPLWCVPGVGVEASIRVALSNSFGMGGNNAALVFRAA